MFIIIFPLSLHVCLLASGMLVFPEKRKWDWYLILIFKINKKKSIYQYKR